MRRTDVRGGIVRRRLTLLVSRDGGGEREKTRDDYSCSHNIGIGWLYLLRSAFSLSPSLSVAVPFAVAKDRFYSTCNFFFPPLLVGFALWLSEGLTQHRAASDGAVLYHSRTRPFVRRSQSERPEDGRQTGGVRFCMSLF